MPFFSLYIFIHKRKQESAFILKKVGGCFLNSLKSYLMKEICQAHQ